MLNPVPCCTGRTMCWIEDRPVPSPRSGLDGNCLRRDLRFRCPLLRARSYRRLCGAATASTETGSASWLRLRRPVPNLCACLRGRYNLACKEADRAGAGDQDPVASG